MKEITLNNNELKVLRVNIGKESYNIPLAKSLSIKEARAMSKDDDGLEFFAKYIPMDVLETLSVEDVATLATSWKEASFPTEDETTPGE